MSNDEVLLNEDQLIESSLEDSSALTEEGELLANGFHIIPAENIKRVYLIERNCQAYSLSNGAGIGYKPAGNWTSFTVVCQPIVEDWSMILRRH